MLSNSLSAAVENRNLYQSSLQHYFRYFVVNQSVYSLESVQAVSDTPKATTVLSTSTTSWLPLRSDFTGFVISFSVNKY